MKRIYFLIAFLFIAVFANAQGNWNSKTQFGGTARYRAVSFVVNGMCYVGTGSTGSTNNQQDFWSYDPTLDVWTQIDDLSGSKRTNATGTTDGTYGYVGLGSNNGVTLSDWWQYDPQTNTWIQKASFPGTSRYGSGAFNIGIKVFVGGGIDSANSVHSDFFLYDVSTDTWISRHALPTPVTSMATYVINGKGYFVGGAINGGVAATMQNAEYDPVADTWTQRATFPGGNIYSCIGFALDGLGYVGTGFCGNLTDIMYRWDPSNDTWTQETNFSSGIRQWAVCCNVNNRAFVGTGNSTGGNLFNDWWEFIPVTTGIETPADAFPKIYFDNSSKQIVVENAMGKEHFEVMSIEGKIVLSGKLENGTNRLYLNSQGIYLVRVKNGGEEKTVKVVRAD